LIVTSYHNELDSDQFDDLVQRLQVEAHFATPEVPGIDEIKVVSDYRATLTNIERLFLYNLRATRRKSDLLDYFRRLSDKYRVEVLVMEAWLRLEDNHFLQPKRVGGLTSVQRDRVK
jgi:hypothetical protein